MKTTNVLKQKYGLAAVTSEPQVDVLDITPAMAMTWLEKNTSNRTLSQGIVEQYAKAMRAGKWRTTNEGIGLGPDGEVYDGQHRLWAIVESRCTVRMVVVRGIPEEARPVLNSGRPQRVTDSLRRLGGETNTTTYAAWANLEHVLLHGAPRALAYDEVKAWIDANRASAEAVFKILGTRRRYRAGITGAFVFAHPVSPAQIERAANQLATLEGLSAGLPMHSVVSYADSTMATDDRRVQALKTLRALEYYIKDKTLGKCRYTEDGLLYFAKERGITVVKK